MLDLPILYEDEDLLVVNKPAGVVVNRAQTQTGETIQDWWLERFSPAYLQEQLRVENKAKWQSLLPTAWQANFGSVEEIWRERLGVVHRLDKDTSGVLVLAKNPGALINLLWQFKQRQTTKKYAALVHGQMTLQMGKINTPLARAKRNRLRFAIDPEGKAAETWYQVRQNFAGQTAVAKLLKQILYLQQQNQPELQKLNKQTIKKITNTYQAGFSLLELVPATGRTHQIRVHMASLQHPLVGDQLYSGKNRSQLDSYWCPRQFLHAAELTLQHPRQRQSLTTSAALAAELQTVLSYLE